MPKVDPYFTRCTCRPGSRNLVICVDGTANQFSEKNSNVVELFSLLVKDANQLAYYNSGIGTYVKDTDGWHSLSWLDACVKWCNHAADMATAWSFKSKVLSAYEWLCENYMPGDRIFLFGFSRGAYQVRVIAGMIEVVGLLHKGNKEQIPFAYELYKRSIYNDKRSKDKKNATQSNNKPNDDTTQSNNQPNDDTTQSNKTPPDGTAQSTQPEDQPRKTTAFKLCEHFKKTFSRPSVKTHFVGVWDTVSSIGLFGRWQLPETASGMPHVCQFRQALALDERRVKFLPEYANGGAGPKYKHIKEVWFAGSHSDIDGGNIPNARTDRFGPSLRWMVYEAIHSGLRMIPHQGEWGPIPLRLKMSPPWWLLEWTPILFSRLTYKTEDDTERVFPHIGRPRKILTGQLIHQSVVDEIAKKQAKSYNPKPKAPPSCPGWNDISAGLVEKDPYTQAAEILSRISSTENGEWNPSEADLHALQTLTSSEPGRLSVSAQPMALDNLITAVWREWHANHESQEDKGDILRTFMQALSAFETSPQRIYYYCLLEKMHQDIIKTFGKPTIGAGTTSESNPTSVSPPVDQSAPASEATPSVLDEQASSKHGTNVSSGLDKKPRTPPSEGDTKSVSASEEPEPLSLKQHKRYDMLEIAISKLQRPCTIFAIVVGIDSYKSWSIPDIPGCVDDANAFAAYLIDDLKTPARQVTVLRNEMATRASIISSIQAIRENTYISPGDHVLFYFSGVGYEVSFLKDERLEHVQVIVPYDYNPHEQVFPLSDRTLSLRLQSDVNTCGANAVIIQDCAFSSITDEYIDLAPDDRENSTSQSQTTSDPIFVKACLPEKYPTQYMLRPGLWNSAYSPFTITLLHALREPTLHASITYAELVSLMTDVHEEVICPVDERFLNYPVFNASYYVYNHSTQDALFQYPVHNVTRIGEKFRMDAGSVHSVEKGDVYDLYTIQGSVRSSSPIIATVTPNPETIHSYTADLIAPSIDTSFADSIVAVQVAHDSEMHRGSLASTAMWRRGLTDPRPISGRPDSALSSPTRSIKNFFMSHTST